MINNDKIEEFKTLFPNEEEELIAIFEDSEFDEFDEFLLFLIQDYFNFLEVSKDINKDKIESLKDFFKNS